MRWSLPVLKLLITDTSVKVCGLSDICHKNNGSGIFGRENTHTAGYPRPEQGRGQSNQQGVNRIELLGY